jgi:3-deoxy-D-manno-octulosonic-acid transferase
MTRSTRRILPSKETLRSKLALDPRRKPVIIAGSTWPGEEDIIARSIQALKHNWPELFLIVAPRHVGRVPEVEQILKANNLATRRRSEPFSGSFDALILDTMGELADFYGLADIAIVGRSLVPGGGQNPIEPAAWGIPVLFGPSMENFQDIAEDLLTTGGGRRVSTESLNGELQRLLSDDSLRHQTGMAARQFIESQTQILERTLRTLEASLKA